MTRRWDCPPGCQWVVQNGEWGICLEDGVVVTPTSLNSPGFIRGVGLQDLIFDRNREEPPCAPRKETTMSIEWKPRDEHEHTEHAEYLGCRLNISVRSYYDGVVRHAWSVSASHGALPHLHGDADDPEDAMRKAIIGAELIAALSEIVGIKPTLHIGDRVPVLEASTKRILGLVTEIAAEKMKDG